ncbi:MAG: hypothetical protein VYA30_07525 [Myxococcota bacterium]|nr:hypothetical protein [Myxococcota bacterium]
MSIRLQIVQLVPLFVAFTILACEPMPPVSIQTHQDLAEPGAPTDAGSVGIDEGQRAYDTDSAVPSVEPCSRDDDCLNSSWCSEVGQCEPRLERRFFDLIQDGLTRVGAASFSLVPDRFETWDDRASVDCPENRKNRFDGTLDNAKPDDPCFDTFDDADADGIFDAVWLGGPGLDRPAQDVDVDNPPEGRALVIARDGQLSVMLTLDLFEMDRGRLQLLTQRLRRRLGLGSDVLSIHVTGIRSGPDATGLSGPSRRISPSQQMDAFHRRSRGAFSFLDSLPVASGVSEDWFHRIVVRADSAIRQAVDNLTPVVYRQTQQTIPVQPVDPDASATVRMMLDSETAGMNADRSALERWRDAVFAFAREQQLPGVVDNQLKAITFDSLETSRTHVVLLSWGAIPAFGSDGVILSGDYIGYLRNLVEENWPGATAVWLTASSTDTFSAGHNVFVPSVNSNGQFLNSDNELVENLNEAAEASQPIQAMATYLFALISSGLANEESQTLRFTKEQRSLWLPVTNPRHILAVWLGLLKDIRHWVDEARPTPNWVDNDTAPNCGGYGCLRYRIDALELSDDLTIVTVPGAWDQSYIYGRASQEIEFSDARQFLDLDGDGRLDARDDEILISSTIGPRTHQYRMESPVNPQRFTAIDGLGRDNRWFVGRTNGGLGSLRPRADTVNVFEGLLDQAWLYSEKEENSSFPLCHLGYPCASELGLKSLIEQMTMAQPTILANIASSHELRCRVPVPAQSDVVVWRLTDEDGRLLAEGDDMVVGPDDRVFALGTDFAALSLGSDSLLWIESIRDEPWAVASVVETKLAWHPNGGDRWNAMFGTRAGDIAYGGVCTLLGGEDCGPRFDVAQDPNSHLPQDP